MGVIFIDHDNLTETCNNDSVNPFPKGMFISSNPEDAMPRDFHRNRNYAILEHREDLRLRRFDSAIWHERKRRERRREQLLCKDSLDRRWAKKYFMPHKRISAKRVSRVQECRCCGQVHPDEIQQLLCYVDRQFTPKSTGDTGFNSIGQQLSRWPLAELLSVSPSK